MSMSMCVQTMGLSENMTRQLYNQLLFMVSQEKQLRVSLNVAHMKSCS